MKVGRLSSCSCRVWGFLVLLSMQISEILAFFFGLASLLDVGWASRQLCSMEFPGAISGKVINLADIKGLYFFDFSLIDSVNFESCESLWLGPVEPPQV
jgi:hypothetical protein